MENTVYTNQEMNEGIRCLHEEFTARSQKNARYSLRAFAKHLGVSHTLLSLIMAGKRPLTLKTAKLVTERLELPPEKAVSLMRVGEASKSKAYNYKYEFLDLKTFDLISDWVHFAILSLTETTSALMSPKWIAKRLAINETQAKVAFQRLTEVGLIAEKDGRWRQTGKPIKVENTVSTSTTKKFHRQMIEKALESLETDPMEVRNFSSVTLAMDPADIPYATERIKQFRRELQAELEMRGTPKEVYNLTIQIYPVSKHTEETV
jgi:uncharacterized protein (TIGR02147 family)